MEEMHHLVAMLCHLVEGFEFLARQATLHGLVQAVGGLVQSDRYKVTDQELVVIRGLATGYDQGPVLMQEAGFDKKGSPLTLGIIVV
jgi:hypothetical protein